jgi:hypothetical protein
MSYSEVTIKRLFARSQNQCAMPKCSAPLIIGETVVGEICHIRARSKKGPRFDATLSAAQRDEFPNLLLLCSTVRSREEVSVAARIMIARQG